MPITWFNPIMSFLLCSWYFIQLCYFKTLVAWCVCQVVSAAYFYDVIGVRACAFVLYIYFRTSFVAAAVVYCYILWASVVWSNIPGGHCRFIWWSWPSNLLYFGFFLFFIMLRLLLTTMLKQIRLFHHNFIESLFCIIINLFWFYWNLSLSLYFVSNLTWVWISSVLSIFEIFLCLNRIFINF